MNKPSSGVVILKVGSKAYGLVKLEKTYSLILSLHTTGIVCNLMEISFNILSNSLKVLDDIEDLEVPGNSTLEIVI